MKIANDPEVDPYEPSEGDDDILRLDNVLRLQEQSQRGGRPRQGVGVPRADGLVTTEARWAAAREQLDRERARNQQE